MQTGIDLEALLFVLHICVGDAMLFIHLRCSGTFWPETRVLIFQMEASDAFLGIREGSSALLLLHNAPGNGSIFTSLRVRSNDIICLQETLREDEFLQAVQVLFLQFRLFGTFTPINVYAGGSAVFIRENLVPDSAADGTISTLSRIDRAFIRLPVAEARDFHCYAHVSDNLGERSIPSDHVAIRVVVQIPTIRCDKGKRIPSWMSKHHFSALF